MNQTRELYGEEPHLLADRVHGGIGRVEQFREYLLDFC